MGAPLGTDTASTVTYRYRYVRHVCIRSYRRRITLLRGRSITLRRLVAQHPPVDRTRVCAREMCGHVHDYFYHA